MFFNSYLQSTAFSQSVSQSGGSLLVEELKALVAEYGFSIEVAVINNKKTKLQDLFITPESGENYPQQSFFYAVARGVSEITSKSMAYRIYTGMVLIDINDQLWAISAENCRKVFELQLLDEQNSLLKKSLKRLRY